MTCDKHGIEKVRRGIKAPYNECRLCRNERHRAWLDANPENRKRRAEEHKLYYQKNKDRIQTQQRRRDPAHRLLVSRRRRLRITYNLSHEVYEQMFRDQNGVCAVCRTPDLSGKFLSVDHCHVTGKVRGLLCNNCNRALGLLKDSAAVLESMIAYISKAGVSR